MSHPRHKLKVVMDPEDATKESYEVDFIVDHRKSGTEMEYLVKWKDCPDEENSWIKASHFNSVEPIKLYWDKSNKPTVDKVRRRRGRPRKLNFLSVIFHFLTILWINCLGYKD